MRGSQECLILENSHGSRERTLLSGLSCYKNEPCEIDLSGGEYQWVEMGITKEVMSVNMVDIFCIHI
jgi:hypothetical protein